ncbi:MAG: class I lanthipeptide [Tannerellaceae bacterium]|nr:class I lanthipeptide [Tannerellaceae bacterium]
MEKKKLKKLVLKKETISTLNEGEMNELKGGYFTPYATGNIGPTIQSCTDASCCNCGGGGTNNGGSGYAVCCGYGGGYNGGGWNPITVTGYCNW